jgi:hypothetical protein
MNFVELIDQANDRGASQSFDCEVNTYAKKVRYAYWLTILLKQVRLV